MGQAQLIISLIAISLFAIAIISFAVNFAIDNDAPISIADDSELSSLNTEMNSNVSSFSSDSESQYKSIIESTIDSSSGTTQSTGPFAITPISSIGVFKNILEVGYIKIFGSGSGFGIFFTTLVGIIVFLMGLFIYKTLRGIPD